MAMTFRGTVIELLDIIDREGGFREPRDQVKIAQARTLIAAGLAPINLTIVVCNIQLCPSRLELTGDLTREAAAAEAERLLWWTDGERHICPGCKER